MKFFTAPGADFEVSTIEFIRQRLDPELAQEPVFFRVPAMPVDAPEAPGIVEAQLKAVVELPGDMIMLEIGAARGEHAQVP